MPIFGLLHSIRLNALTHPQKTYFFGLGPFLGFGMDWNAPVFVGFWDDRFGF